MLKENGKSRKPKTQKEFIVCKGCKKRIDINDINEKDYIIKVGNTKIYQCNCGEDIIL